MFEDLYVCITRVMYKVWDRRPEAVSQCRNLEDWSCIKIWVSPGCLNRVSTLLFGDNMLDPKKSLISNIKILKNKEDGFLP
jgi:hypothetical protein